MADVIEGFFNRLARCGYAPLLHGVSGTVQLRIENEGNWYVKIDHGALQVSKDSGQKADCILESDREVFTRIIEGKQNAITAYMQGMTNASGDIGLGQVFQRLFP